MGFKLVENNWFHFNGTYDPILSGPCTSRTLILAAQSLCSDMKAGPLSHCQSTAQMSRGVVHIATALGKLILGKGRPRRVLGQGGVGPGDSILSLFLYSPHFFPWTYTAIRGQ